MVYTHMGSVRNRYLGVGTSNTESKRRLLMENGPLITVLIIWTIFLAVWIGSNIRDSLHENRKRSNQR